MVQSSTDCFPLRLEEAVETFAAQAGLQFFIAGPEMRVEVQGEGDEGRVFQVHAVKKAPGLRDGFDRAAPAGPSLPFSFAALTEPAARGKGSPSWRSNSQNSKT